MVIVIIHVVDGLLGCRLDEVADLLFQVCFRNIFENLKWEHSIFKMDLNDFTAIRIRVNLHVFPTTAFRLFIFLSFILLKTFHLLCIGMGKSHFGLFHYQTLAFTSYNGVSFTYKSCELTLTLSLYVNLVSALFVEIVEEAVHGA